MPTGAQAVPDPAHPAAEATGGCTTEGTANGSPTCGLLESNASREACESPCPALELWRVVAEAMPLGGPSASIGRRLLGTGDRSSSSSLTTRFATLDASAGTEAHEAAGGAEANVSRFTARQRPGLSFRTCFIWRKSMYRSASISTRSLPAAHPASSIASTSGAYAFHSAPACHDQVPTDRRCTTNTVPARIFLSSAIESPS